MNDKKTKKRKTKTKRNWTFFVEPQISSGIWFFSQKPKKRDGFVFLGGFKKPIFPGCYKPPSILIAGVLSAPRGCTSRSSHMRRKPAPETRISDVEQFHLHIFLKLHFEFPNFQVVSNFQTTTSKVAVLSRNFAKFGDMFMNLRRTLNKKEHFITEIQKKHQEQFEGYFLMRMLGRRKEMPV